MHINFNAFDFLRVRLLYVWLLSRSTSMCLWSIAFLFVVDSRCVRIASCSSSFVFDILSFRLLHVRIGKVRRKSTFKRRIAEQNEREYKGSWTQTKSSSFELIFIYFGFDFLRVRFRCDGFEKSFTFKFSYKGSPAQKKSTTCFWLNSCLTSLCLCSTVLVFATDVFCARVALCSTYFVFDLLKSVIFSMLVLGSRSHRKSNIKEVEHKRCRTQPKWTQNHNIFYFVCVRVLCSRPTSSCACSTSFVFVVNLYYCHPSLCLTSFCVRFTLGSASFVLDLGSPN